MWMEPQHSIPDSLNPVYLTGLSKTSMHTELFEKTAKMEEVYNSNTQSDTQMFIKPRNFGYIPCNRKFSPFIEINKQAKKQDSKDI